VCGGSSHFPVKDVNITQFLQLNIVNQFRLNNASKDTLEKELENDDLIVGIIIMKAAPLNVFVQDKRANAVPDDTREEK
jgi:hypothetical protein